MSPDNVTQRGRAVRGLPDRRSARTPGINSQPISDTAINGAIDPRGKALTAIWHDGSRDVVRSAYLESGGHVRLQRIVDARF